MWANAHEVPAVIAALLSGMHVLLHEPSKRNGGAKVRLDMWEEELRTVKSILLTHVPERRVAHHMFMPRCQGTVTRLADDRQHG
jgi:hypothetical protein